MGLQLTGKTITDPLYGNIKLTEIESKLVSARAFQRLHNVRQLGLGHLVFPSAGYSRFAHSVGACHNADRIILAIEYNSGHEFSPVERQAFRLAALFHDLGHYPFSHTTEHAIKKFYREGIYNKTDKVQHHFSIFDDAHSAPQYLDHEDNGGLIFQEDSEINEIFNRSSEVSKEDVTNVYLDENLLTIISSDLDCDRLDYLKRTALHSGAPYGAVDVDFIISKSTIDGSGRFCFDRKAIRAADHLLVSRFYDFMQIPYHKTVASLEWSLEEAVIYLLRIGRLKLSEADTRRMLADGSWSDFDDGAMVATMRATFDAGVDDEVSRDHLAAVLQRRSAKMVFNWECLVENGRRDEAVIEERLNEKIADLCTRIGIDRRRFTVWKAPFKLSKAGPILQGAPGNNEEYSDEERQQLIHVLRKREEKSVPLIDLPNAVSHHLAKLRYKVLRVYYLMNPSDSTEFKEQLRTEFANVDLNVDSKQQG